MAAEPENKNNTETKLEIISNDDQQNKPQKENKNDKVDIKDDEKKNDNNVVAILQKKEAIKILFLDIDGVMNGSEDLFENRWAYMNGKIIQLFRAYHVDRLKRILQKTGCKIVLSTAWRRDIELKSKIQKEFIKKGIKWNDVYIGDTPIECGVGSNGDISQRTFEIDKYLKSIDAKYVVKTWCAVDDMCLDRSETDKQIMTGHFVQTDGFVGITDNDTLEIIRILNN